MEFKGTKGKLERKYVSGICIGIGTIGAYSQITATSILLETDEEYEKEKTEIEANMLLYSKAPDMLEVLKSVLELQKENYGSGMDTHLAMITKAKEIQQLIKEATEL